MVAAGATPAADSAAVGNHAVAEVDAAAAAVIIAAAEGGAAA